MELLLGLFVVATAILGIAYLQLSKQHSEVRTIDREIERKEQELRRSVDDLMRSQQQFSQAVVVLQQQKQQMEESIRKEIIDKRLEVVSNVKEYENNERRKIDYILEKLAAASESQAVALLENYEGYQEYIRNKEKDIVEGLEDAAAKYAATISVFRQLDLEAQQLTAYMIQLSENDREDIAFLINDVVPKLHSPQLLNKLIWTEYVMKPTGELLKRILPDKECSGIYKITHVPDKKAYIGRSTSVYKRLQEHIKSSLGVGTIADQWVHHQMREKGIENFTFELVEECDKDKLSEREKYYIGFFQTENYGYNRSIGG